MVTAFELSRVAPEAADAAAAQFVDHSRRWTPLPWRTPPLWSLTTPQTVSTPFQFGIASTHQPAYTPRSRFRPPPLVLSDRQPLVAILQTIELWRISTYYIAAHGQARGLPTSVLYFRLTVRSHAGTARKPDTYMWHLVYISDHAWHLVGSRRFSCSHNVFHWIAETTDDRCCER